MWIKPVTDRTDIDCYLTHEDMNRICGNITYLAPLLTAEGYDADVSVVTNWYHDDYVHLAQWQTIYQWCQHMELALTGAITINADFTWSNLNAIERMMTVANMIPNQTKKYSGEFYAGEEILC